MTRGGRNAKTIRCREQSTVVGRQSINWTIELQMPDVSVFFRLSRKKVRVANGRFLDRNVWCSTPPFDEERTLSGHQNHNYFTTQKKGKSFSFERNYIRHKFTCAFISWLLGAYFCFFFSFWEMKSSKFFLPFISTRGDDEDDVDDRNMWRW